EKDKLFNEWERFTSTDGESFKSYYHRFSKLMNDFKRNKHLPKKIASNLKFLNNLQPERRRHVTIVNQTKDFHTTDYTQLYDFLKYNKKEVDELRAKRLAKTHDPLALMANSNKPFNFPVFHPDQQSASTYMQQPLPNNNYNLQPSFNQNYMQQPIPNTKDITDPTTAMNMALVLIIAQPGMNMGQDRQMQMVGGNDGNQFRQYARQNVRNQNRYNAVQNVENQVVQNAVQNPSVQNVENQNGLIVVLGIANQNPNGNGNVVATRVEGNANGNNGNQIRCYNCRGLGHLARNYTVRPRRMDAAYLQTQLLIAQKEEAGIQLQAEEFDLMAVAANLDEIKEVNANCILMANLQQALTSGTQTDKALVYDLDGSAEVHHYETCYNNDIFNMFTREEHYTEVLEPIPKPHQVQQNDSNVISEVSSVEQSGGTVDQHPATVEETRAYFELLYNNLAIEVEKEAATFVRDFKSLANEADASLAKHKAFEFEIKRLLREVVSQYTMSIVQNPTVVETSDLQIELDRTKERFENSYKDMQQKIERLQAQLGDQKGKSEDTTCVSDTLDPLSQKLENENVELEFQLRAQLFDKVSEQKDLTKGTVVNTKFINQSTMGNPFLQPLRNHFVVRQPNAFQSERPKLVPPKVVESNDLSNLVTSNSVPITTKVNVMKNDRASVRVRTKPITVSQPHVITKKEVNSNTNGFPSTRVESTAKTRRPQPRKYPKNDRIPSASKSSRLSNNLETIKEHHRNLLFSKTPNHRSSVGNNIKLAVRNDKSKVVCATCKQCLIIANHDECMFKYMNGMSSSKKNQHANVLKSANQKKNKANIKKSKKLGSKDNLASTRPSKPRTCLRRLPTRRIFDLFGKITTPNHTESVFDTSVCDNESASNPQEPTRKGFLNSTSFLDKFTRLWRQNTSIHPLAGS
ncbi:hypothetical protein Tco_1270560, partial [Tanacetum coccineum]